MKNTGSRVGNSNKTPTEDPRFDEVFPPPDTIKPFRKWGRKKRTPKKDLEGTVLRECREALTALKEVVYIERRNSGSVKFTTGGFIRFGSPGAADLWCLIRHERYCSLCGTASELTHVEVECKRRDGKGRLSEDQKLFKHFCEESGIPYFVVTSADDMLEQLRKADLLQI